MKGTPRPVQNTQDIPVGGNVPVFLFNCPHGSREEPLLMGSVASVSPLSGRLDACYSVAGKGAS